MTIMRNLNFYRRSLLIIAGFVMALAVSTPAWSHGDKIQIIPETIHTKSGATLLVKVNGLVDTKTAIFSLTGLSGKYDLGQFDISADDFSQILQIPEDLPAGTYRLTVEGGGNSAKIVITIN
jgi:hypothetical protein